MNFFEEYHEKLYKCTKPYQYVGGEMFSYNKDFNSADVRFAMCFPDKYEIGVSNLGAKILYNEVNKCTNYMADRAYAPEPDFIPNILYGVESKKPLCDFDIVAFSFQYELSYPTVLKMLEMSNIPIRNKDRNDTHPIIIAGGPCTYNPMPMSDFVDVFQIGDGEQSVIDVCDCIKKTKGMPRQERIKELSKLKGCWSKLVGGTVQKRVELLKNETALTKHPIAFSSAVHDRATIEIRRGCGRMCRFCQPGHVTLPVRERNAKDIIQITKELVKNTGYDEYSLLSLSSNDYSNIKEVIKELSCDFDKKEISVSLPSQRIDGFNLELAELTQKVRKSTMTLAPEAGSQRLRNVIKKNISEEQILNAVCSLYENGWSRVKFYFIIGLPTETLQDMDEMAELFEKIKRAIQRIKQEKNLKHGFSLTCTLSIFVPKPFTPFQYCPQTDIDTVMEHIHYLKDKVKHIKWLKLNYHDFSTSQIEAVLTRGDDTLCKYIEELYKKGCYLDAWGEYFNKNIWQETAEECGINLKKLAQKEYSTTEVLPWDFIDTGLKKEWLSSEYKIAFEQGNEFNLQPTCEHKCVNCGVCTSLKVKKRLDEPYISPNYKENQEIEKIDVNSLPVYRYRLKITKSGILRYFSHLDWQNTFSKSVLRTGLDLNFTQGFNPMPKISVGIALPLFIESDCEIADIELHEKISIEELIKKLQPELPNGCKILTAKQIDRSSESIELTACWAEYKITPIKKDDCILKSFIYNCNRVLSSDEILFEKKNKKGLTKTLNIKPSIKSYEFKDENLFIILKTGQNNDLPALRADALINFICSDIIFDIKRLRFFDDSMQEL